jgi:hypothetical protein
MLAIARDYPSLIIRRPAFERAGIARSHIDALLGLTDEEFRVSGDLVIIGPIHDDAAIQQLTAELEGAGLAWFEDFFDLSGQWPGWLRLFAADAGRPSPNDESTTPA